MKELTLHICIVFFACVLHYIHTRYVHDFNITSALLWKKYGHKNTPLCQREREGEREREREREYVCVFVCVCVCAEYKNAKTIPYTTCSIILYKINVLYWEGKYFHELLIKQTAFPQHCSIQTIVYSFVVTYNIFPQTNCSFTFSQKVIKCWLKFL